MQAAAGSLGTKLALKSAETSAGEPPTRKYVAEHSRSGHLP